MKIKEKQEKEPISPEQIDQILDPGLSPDTFIVRGILDGKPVERTWQIRHLTNWAQKRWRAGLRELDHQTIVTIIGVVTGKSEPDDAALDIIKTREAAETGYPWAIAYLVREQDPDFLKGNNEDDVNELSKWLDHSMTFDQMQDVVFHVEQKLEVQKNLLNYWTRTAAGILQAAVKNGLVSDSQVQGITPWLQQYLGLTMNEGGPREPLRGSSTGSSSGITSPPLPNGDIVQ